MRAERVLPGEIPGTSTIIAFRRVEQNNNYLRFSVVHTRSKTLAQAYRSVYA